jgi:hypothetical protein
MAGTGVSESYGKAALIDCHENAEEHQVGRHPDIAREQRASLPSHEIKRQDHQRGGFEAEGSQRERIEMPQRDFTCHIVERPDEKHGNERDSED